MIIDTSIQTYDGIDINFKWKVCLVIQYMRLLYMIELQILKMLDQFREAIETYFFGIYFFSTIYLFIEDLLGFINCINISSHPHCGYVCMHWVVPVFQRTHTARIYVCTEGLREIYLKMHRDLLKNFNKFQKNKFR